MTQQLRMWYDLGNTASDDVAIDREICRWIIHFPNRHIVVLAAGDRPGFLNTRLYCDNVLVSDGIAEESLLGWRLSHAPVVPSLPGSYITVCYNTRTGLWRCRVLGVDMGEPCYANANEHSEHCCRIWQAQQFRRANAKILAVAGASLLGIGVLTASLFPQNMALASFLGALLLVLGVAITCKISRRQVMGAHCRDLLFHDYTLRFFNSS